MDTFSLQSLVHLGVSSPFVLSLFSGASFKLLVCIDCFIVLVFRTDGKQGSAEGDPSPWGHNEHRHGTWLWFNLLLGLGCFDDWLVACDSIDLAFISLFLYSNTAKATYITLENSLTFLIPFLHPSDGKKIVFFFFNIERNKIIITTQQQ